VDGSTIPLGRTPTTNGDCDLDQQFLVCPTLDGFRAWRFATP